jgi:uncharacterized membrane protein YeiH
VTTGPINQLTPSVVPGINATLILVLSLIGVFVFGLSGGMAGVRAQLDLFGAMLLAVVVGIAGGTIRDILIGISPATFRDWRYLAVAGAAGLIAPFAHPAIRRLHGWIDVLDAAGLGLFCVVGADTALAHHLGFADCVILGAVTGIGGGMLRDILVREIPMILRGGFYAIPAFCGAGIVVTAYRAGDHSIVFPIVGAVVCFLMRIAGMRYGLGLPSAAVVAEVGPRAFIPYAPETDAADQADDDPET